MAKDNKNRNFDNDKLLMLSEHLRKLATPDFSSIDKELIPKYVERQNQLVEFKKIIDYLIDLNKVMGKDYSERWENIVAESNIIELKKMKNKLNLQLKRKEVNKFVLASQGKSSALLRMSIGDYPIFSLFEICLHSPLTSIKYDLNWLQQLSINDYIDIALGNKSPDILISSIPDIISSCSNYVQPFLEKNTNYEYQYIVYKEVVKSSNEQNYLISNILLFTLIESIVKKICVFAFTKQNPHLTPQEIENFVYYKHKSISGLLTDDEWKRDFVVGNTELLYLLKNNLDEEMIKLRKSILKQIPQDEINKFDNQRLKDGKPISEEFNTLKPPPIYISIGVRLHILQRIYNKDRNQIIHGYYEGLNHSWKNYIYLSILQDICIVGSKYEDIYAN